MIQLSTQPFPGVIPGVRAAGSPLGTTSDFALALADLAGAIGVVAAPAAPPGLAVVPTIDIRPAFAGDGKALPDAGIVPGDGAIELPPMPGVALDELPPAPPELRTLHVASRHASIAPPVVLIPSRAAPAAIDGAAPSAPAAATEDDDHPVVLDRPPNAAQTPPAAAPVTVTMPVIPPAAAIAPPVVRTVGLNPRDTAAAPVETHAPTSDVEPLAEPADDPVAETPDTLTAAPPPAPERGAAFVMPAIASTPVATAAEAGVPAVPTASPAAVAVAPLADASAAKRPPLGAAETPSIEGTAAPGPPATPKPQSKTTVVPSRNAMPAPMAAMAAAPPAVAAGRRAAPAPGVAVPIRQPGSVVPAIDPDIVPLPTGDVATPAPAATDAPIASRRPAAQTLAPIEFQPNVAPVAAPVMTDAAPAIASAPLPQLAAPAPTRHDPTMTAPDLPPPVADRIAKALAPAAVGPAHAVVARAPAPNAMSAQPAAPASAAPLLASLVGVLPTTTAAVAAPATVEPPRAIDRAAPAPVAVTVVALPAAPPPPLQPAGQAFAAAMFAAAAPVAAVRDERDDTLPLSLASAAAPTTLTAPTIAVAATGHGQQAALDLARGDWMASMIDHIETLRDESGGVRETRMKLAPEALGNVEVSVRRDEAGVLQVRIAADTPQARALLAEAAPKLAEMAEARGVRLGGSSVDTNPGSADHGRRDTPAAPAPVQRRPATAGADTTDTTTDSRLA